ncbi:hypothetical protein BHE74_00059769 [Ensete ventricosum]|nr:hypothetical protein GW17_00062159 [Ensete ventricosum]RWW35305.1 hypothetical protein BHE74_00059769 [Ensete ventricosum]
MGWETLKVWVSTTGGASTTTSCKEPVRCSTKWLREEVSLISGCTCMQCRPFKKWQQYVLCSFANEDPLLQSLSDGTGEASTATSCKEPVRCSMKWL